MTTAYLSHSTKKDVEICPRAQQHKDDGWELRKRPSYFVRGKAVHEFIRRFTQTGDVAMALRAVVQAFDAIDLSLHTPKEIKDHHTQRQLSLGMCRGYARRYGEVDKAEFTQFIAEVDMLRDKGIELGTHEGVTHVYHGLIDCLVKDLDGAWWVKETKTGESFAEATGQWLYIDSQTNGYLVLAERYLGVKPAGIIYDCIGIPGIRQKKKQTEADFLIELENELVNDPKDRGYFNRIKVHVPQKNLERWKVDAFQTAVRLESERQSKQPRQKYTHSCLGKYNKPCQWLMACRFEEYNEAVYRNVRR